jgi:hypothetical protein
MSMLRKGTIFCKWNDLQQCRLDRHDMKQNGTDRALPGLLASRRKL